MILGIPVVDGHDLTDALLKSLEQTVTGENFEVVIFDNNSDKPYKQKDFNDYIFPVNVVWSDTNLGFYRPLENLKMLYQDELIGLIHNDMVIYEHGWNERMEAAFSADPLLGLVGLCGSSELDSLGGRGGGTKCYFRGAEVKIGDRIIKAQSQDAGLRITDLAPSVVLDSLFMMFRRGAIEHLVVAEGETWSDITLAHFYDRIWPCRVIEAGMHVATMGVECDHLGGMTTTGNERYRDDCIKWFKDRGLPYDNPETDMYLIAEQRFLQEYREQKHFMPVTIDAGYNLNPRRPI